MNVVVLGCEHLPQDVDFPPLDLPKFGWLQFLSLSDEDVVERCWRADAIVTINVPISTQVIDEAFKLKLIISAGDSVEHIDLAPASKRGISVLNIPKMELNHDNAQDICNQIVQMIDAFNRGEMINKVN